MFTRDFRFREAILPESPGASGDNGQVCRVFHVSNISYHIFPAMTSTSSVYIHNLAQFLLRPIDKAIYEGYNKDAAQLWTSDKRDSQVGALL